MLFNSGHLQHERVRLEMERKYMNSDKIQSKSPSLQPLISEVGGGTNIQSKQGRILQYKS